MKLNHKQVFIEKGKMESREWLTFRVSVIPFLWRHALDSVLILLCLFTCWVQPILHWSWITSWKRRLQRGSRQERGGRSIFEWVKISIEEKKKITKITKKKNNHKNINFEIISKNYEIWERKPDNLERRMSDLEGQGYRLEVFGMKKTGKVYAVLAFMRQFLHFAKENGENTLDLQTCLDQSLLEKYFKFALSFLSFPFLSSGKKLQNKYR